MQESTWCYLRSCALRIQGGSDYLSVTIQHTSLKRESPGSEHERTSDWAPHQKPPGTYKSRRWWQARVYHSPKREVSFTSLSTAPRPHVTSTRKPWRKLSNDTPFAIRSRLPKNWSRTSITHPRGCGIVPDFVITFSACTGTCCLYLVLATCFDRLPPCFFNACFPLRFSSKPSCSIRLAP